MLVVAGHVATSPYRAAVIHRIRCARPSLRMLLIRALERGISQSGVAAAAPAARLSRARRPGGAVSPRLSATGKTRPVAFGLALQNRPFSARCALH